jgi:hypothetical protein
MYIETRGFFYALPRFVGEGLVPSRITLNLREGHTRLLCTPEKKAGRSNASQNMRTIGVALKIEKGKNGGILCARQ